MKKINEIKLEKIIIHTGLGRMSQRPHFKDKILPEIMKEMSLISGQKPAVRCAKKSISNFKTRTGDIIGAQVTLRGKKMKDFFYKLIYVAIPRVKDFRGLSLSCIDSHGNLNLGFKEQYVFPEIIIEQSTVNFGLQVTVVLNKKNKKSAIDFYKSEKVPLKK